MNKKVLLEEIKKITRTEKILLNIYMLLKRGEGVIHLKIL